MYPDEIKILDIVKDSAKRKRCLNIYRYIPEFLKVQKEVGIGVEYLPVNTKNYVNSENVETWEEGIESFLQLATQAEAQYGLVVIAPEAGNLEFRKSHKEIIRTINNQVLEAGGITLLIIRDQDFILDPYIRPGADRITKFTIPENLARKEKKPHQAFAFYG
ncbi:hypothetical protein D6810_01865 [Candidatus Dojkabacteria bacterium]|uniref:Uncharacterized protein n=1 Tax=Candidatus Dojkabacteria bacterium TaxID=2099670 RepID=A0A3M0Z077_9BACT|nr:MAG: hypothetical protein D6810_01865 [Candidatus Dojkabacteria bacterium]